MGMSRNEWAQLLALLNGLPLPQTLKDTAALVATASIAGEDGEAAVQAVLASDTVKQADGELSNALDQILGGRRDVGIDDIEWDSLA